MKNSKKFAAFIMCLIIALSGVMPTYAASGKWIKSGNRWWYRHADSSYTTDDWEKINGKWYHFDKNGWMQSNRWLKDNGKWYYLNASGAMRTGWLKQNNEWYYLNTSGAMHTGWLKYKNEWYYLDTNGAMETFTIREHGYIDTAGVWRKNAAFDFNKTVVKIEMAYGDVPATAKHKTSTDKAFITETVNYLKDLSISTKEHELSLGGAYTLIIYYSDNTLSVASIGISEDADLYSNGVYYTADYHDIADFYNRI